MAHQSPTLLSNVLSRVPLEEQTRVFRSARKLEQVLGTDAFLNEDAASRSPLRIRVPTRPLAGLPLLSPTNMGIHSPSQQRSRARGAKRHASIFELTEAERKKLGMQIRKRTEPQADIGSPAASPSAESDSGCSDSPSMFNHSNLSSASTAHTSVDGHSQPTSPAKPASAAPAAAPQKRKPRRPPPALAIRTTPTASNARARLAKDASALPLSPRTPATPTDVDIARIRARKLSKMKRTFGENIPPELLFGGLPTIKARRTSISSPHEARSATLTPPSRASLDIDDREPLLGGARASPAPFATSFDRMRKRAQSTARPAESQGRASLADDEREPSPPPPPPPSHALLIFGSSKLQPESERWIGSWNRPDITTVQSELRALRRR